MSSVMESETKPSPWIAEGEWRRFELYPDRNNSRLIASSSSAKVDNNWAQGGWQE